MVQLTFYPLNNADTCLIELADGRLMLVDYAHCKVGEDAEEPVVDLRKALEEKLKELNRTHIDIVLFTHADRDHIRNASEFFWFDHAAVYQGPDRIKISELWVPAAFVLETELDECARVIRQEARHRLNLGDGIRVFSTPGLLEGWLVDHGLSAESRQHLISDAGTLVPSFSLTSDGVEFFVHSPFAHRDGDTLQSRNDGSVFLQVVFSVEGQQTSLMLGADSEWEVLKEIVRITNYHNRPERLLWDLFKLPHHCSSGVLATDKGVDETVPDPDVAFLFEQGSIGCTIVSPSKPIPSEDTDQPPHRQAARYYEKIVRKKQGQFIVTMEHPSVTAPEPLVILITNLGPQVKRKIHSVSVGLAGSVTPRAG